jgi:hypothetical protein
VALDMLAAPAVAIASVALFLATASLFAAQSGDVVDGVRTVFLCAAPLAGLALLAVVRLPEARLRAKIA